MLARSVVGQRVAACVVGAGGDVIALDAARAGVADAHGVCGAARLGGTGDGDAVVGGFAHGGRRSGGGECVPCGCKGVGGASLRRVSETCCHGCGAGTYRAVLGPPDCEQVVRRPSNGVGAGDGDPRGAAVGVGQGFGVRGWCTGAVAGQVADRGVGQDVLTVGGVPVTTVSVSRRSTALTLALRWYRASKFATSRSWPMVSLKVHRPVPAVGVQVPV